MITKKSCNVIFLFRSLIRYIKKNIQKVIFLLDGEGQKSFLINNPDQNYWHVISLKSQSQQWAQISSSFNKNIKKKTKK